MPAKREALNQNVSWAERQQALVKIEQFHIAGAVAIKTPQQAQTANVNWQQQQQTFAIALYGPLGAGRVTLSGAPGHTQLLASGKTYRAKTPEALMQQVLGWHLPISHLDYWIRGLPAPHSPAQLHFDEFNHLIQLQQDGWQIDYQRYTAVEQYDLPSKLQMTYDGKLGHLSVRMVISQWTLA